MRPSLVSGLLTVALGLTAAAPHVHGTRVDVDARVDLAAGYDSNPLLVSGDGPGGGFAQFSFHTGIDVPTGRRVALFLDAAGLGRRYDSGAEHGDYERADLRAGVILPKIRVGRTRLSFAAGGMYTMRRSTYTDRLTGEIYEITVDPVAVPPVTVPIPDRFDSDTTGAFLDLGWRMNRRLRFFLDSGYEKTSYVEDYSAATGLDSLDYRSVFVEPGFAYRVNDLLVLVGSLAWTGLDFDEQPALDSGGTEVPGATREYRYTQYRLRAVISPGRFWQVNVGWLGSDREDAHAGYYDFDGWAGFISAARPLGLKSRVQFIVSDQRQDYHSATVAGDPNGETRASDTRRFATRYDHALRGGLGLFVEGGMQTTDNEDPLFAYDRDWTSMGISVGWR